MPDPITEREKTLASVFYHPRTGFGSVEQTFKQAKARDVGITRQHVRDFIAKQEIRQRRKPLKVNSFVADFPRQEFQVDLMDMGENVTPRYGFVTIDIFSKKGACVPIRNKFASDTAEALRKTFAELGYPASIMCDEGREFQGEFAEECKKEAVDIIRSRTGGRFVERFIRTLKLPIFERRKALGGNWTSYVQDVVDRYNDSTHASIHAKPSFVAEHEYDFDVLEDAHKHMMKRAKFPVKHEGIEVGDHVKIRIKPSAFYKETFNSWSSEIYPVERVDTTAPEGTLYHLTGYRRPLLRFEIKKVADVHRYNGEELHSVFDEVKHGAPAAEPPPVHPLPQGIPQAPAMSHNPTRAQIRVYNDWADRYGQPRFGAQGPAAPPVRRRVIPSDVAANMRNEGGHRMMTRRMKSSYLANN